MTGAGPRRTPGGGRGRRPPIRTPGGKGRRDENFPVGSFLLARRMRPPVAAFYAFARRADDIADDPGLAPDEKIARLDRLEAELASGEGAGARHGRDLLRAFRRDAVKRRCDDWEDLMGYCALSAAPVGRFLLDLHGEDPACYRFSDPLCAALQVLNHLQDMRDDYLALDRVYLPGDWMAARGARDEDLAGRGMTPALREVADLCLDGCRRLADEARPLPRRLRGVRLAMETGAVLRLADRLAARLRAGDPTAARIAPTRADFAASGLGGVLAAVLRRRPQESASLPSAGPDRI